MMRNYTVYIAIRRRTIPMLYISLISSCVLVVGCVAMLLFECVCVIPCWFVREAKSGQENRKMTQLLDSETELSTTPHSGFQNSVTMTKDFSLHRACLADPPEQCRGHKRRRPRAFILPTQMARTARSDLMLCTNRAESKTIRNKHAWR